MSAGVSRATPRRTAGLPGWAIACLLSVASGCVSTPYTFGDFPDTEYTLELREGETQIERGRPNAFLDGIGHYLISLPSKILLLNWHINNHDISDRTESQLREYLELNDLRTVKIRLNEYAPGGEWSRLARNRDVPAGWRWTLGLLSNVVYTILPGRFFAGLLGGDSYNPYTNTINLYSDSVPVALHEAGHAKDFASKRNRQWKGGYAALRILPLVPLWQEAVASNDAVSYLYEVREDRELKSAYRTLYPAYGTYVGNVGGTTTQYLPLGTGWIYYAIAYGPVVVGHVVGQTRALFVEVRPDEDVPEVAPEAPSPEPAPAPAPVLLERDDAALAP